jgi:hypothetical protein
LLEEIVKVGEVVIVEESLVSKTVWIPVTLRLIGCRFFLQREGSLGLGWWRKCWYIGKGGCFGKMWLLGESM